MEPRNAILFGASGFIGSFLLEELLNDPTYEQVTIVVRKDLGVTHTKLKTLIGDFNSLPAMRSDLIGDDVFIALGTTRKNTPDEKIYYQVDHDYPVRAAKLAKQNGAKSVFVVTAIGANANSSVFYVRTKGETERDVIALNMDHTYIFRPSMIMGNRKENRPMEKTFMSIFSVVNPLLVGPMKKFKGIEGADVARAMVVAAKHPKEKVKIYEWQEMNSLLTSS
ncbi:hypothetical protein DYBT9623_00828 [Dyadobacter sp. CECT 9623]|uniref:NAD(P)-binding domain-containing protein n=1 Tax=Dyadobacter linearis TaxID=2823330 RepID=A0ABN7R1Q8_9BACT|nr:NAD(P)H-binding protein [Dyadobacter sp. CECT 9623]CAG5068100.1 hypothetical protein DYBT9623_00828 [Dyadobacter sp. CECT 9623]